MRKELRATSYMGKKTVELLASDEKKLPAFIIGRQLMVVSCFFILARMTTPDVELGQGQNIFDVSDGFQSFLNTGVHAALLTTIWIVHMEVACHGLSCWFHGLTLPASYVLLWIGLALEGLGICSGAWALAWISKKVMRLKKDEVCVGTPENPTLSTDALDREVVSLDNLVDPPDVDVKALEEGASGKSFNRRTTMDTEASGGSPDSDEEEEVTKDEAPAEAKGKKLIVS